VEGDLVTEGVGKTGMSLMLMGVALPYKALRDGIQSNPQRMEEIPIKKSGNHCCELIASDMGYFGELRGQLCMVRPKGELLIAAWDICRHIYRMIDPTYYPGKRRTPEGRKGLKTTISHICLLDISRLISWEKDLHEIDIIFLLKPVENINGKGGPILERIPPRKVQSILLPAFLYPTIHDSPFWKRDKILHEKRVKEIFMQFKTIPPCFKIIMPLVGKALLVEESVKVIMGLLSPNLKINRPGGTD
jgi:hypothetical protein